MLWQSNYLLFSSKNLSCIQKEIIPFHAALILKNTSTVPDDLFSCWNKYQNWLKWGFVYTYLQPTRTVCWWGFLQQVYLFIFFYMDYQQCFHDIIPIKRPWQHERNGNQHQHPQVLFHCTLPRNNCDCETVLK